MGGLIETPGGIGSYISFDGNTGKVTVEMDWQHEVEYPGDKCFPVVKGGSTNTTRNLRIAATLALNAVEEHLVGSYIDWHDVARVLREALGEN